MEKEIVKRETQEKEINIFGETPEDVLKMATKIAKMVAKVVESQEMYCVISGKKYVRCEGWTTMGSILGLRAIITEVKEEENEIGEKKYIAVAEVYKGERLISRAESECAAWEKRRLGEKQDDYVLRSMAQTRAIAKAYRLCLSWVMALAGYEPTPAEEMESITVEEKKVINVNETPKVKTQPKPEVDDEKIVLEELRREEQRKALYDEVVKMCKEKRLTSIEIMPILEKISPLKKRIRELSLEELGEFKKEIEKLPKK